MVNLHNLRTKIRDFVLPKISYEIGKREKIAARISPENHYTITIQEKGSYDTELTCLTVKEGNELIEGVFYTGKTPEKGNILKLGVFIPGITSGMNYGEHDLPVRAVKKISRNLDEVIVDSKDIDWKNM